MQVDLGGHIKLYIQPVRLFECARKSSLHQDASLWSNAAWAGCMSRFEGPPTLLLYGHKYQGGGPTRCVLSQTCKTDDDVAVLQQKCIAVFTKRIDGNNDNVSSPTTG